MVNMYALLSFTVLLFPRHLIARIGVFAFHPFHQNLSCQVVHQRQDLRFAPGCHKNAHQPLAPVEGGETADVVVGLQDELQVADPAAVDAIANVFRSQRSAPGCRFFKAGAGCQGAGRTDRKNIIIIF